MESTKAGVLISSSFLNLFQYLFRSCPNVLNASGVDQIIWNNIQVAKWMFKFDSVYLDRSQLDYLE